MHEYYLVKRKIYLQKIRIISFLFTNYKQKHKIWSTIKCLQGTISHDLLTVNEHV